MKDLIIVGGGLMGAALAYHTARLGMAVTLVESAVIGGAGATAHSRGIVRVYDPQPALMQWSLRGVLEWQNWSLSAGSPFVRCGIYYFVKPANRESVLSTLEQHDHAVYPIAVMDASALPANVRHLADANGLVLYEAGGGHVDTRLAARLFAQGARDHGATLLEGSTVLGIGESDQQVTVRLRDGRLAARQLVLATGAATSALLGECGLFSRSIPLSCIEQQATSPLQFCLIDEVTGSYARPDGADVFYCGGATQHDALIPEHLVCDLAASGQQNVALAQHLLAQPTLALLDTRMGYDAYTQDFLPQLGACEPYRRVCMATGFSGRGAKYIPAVASELALDLVQRKGC